MLEFIDEHRAMYGVESICRELPIAPSSYYAAKAEQRDPSRVSRRRRREQWLSEQIRRVYEANRSLYGARKVWRQLRREGIEVARCTVERVMRRLGLRGVVRGARCRTTVAASVGSLPLDRVERRFEVSRPSAL